MERITLFSDDAGQLLLSPCHWEGFPFIVALSQLPTIHTVPPQQSVSKVEIQDGKLV